METKLKYKSMNSNAPGTFFETIDFSRDGETIAPFRGGRFTVERGATSKLDQHEVRECWMIAQGEGELEFNGDKFISVKAGEFYFFDSMETHRIKNTGVKELIIHSVWWDK